MQAVPGSTPNSLVVLADFDLSGFKPGAYVLQVNAEDIVRHGGGIGKLISRGMNGGWWAGLPGELSRFSRG
jgi:hypothetical protein